MSSRSRLIPLIVTGATAILYLATLSRHYTGDSIEYALAIELGNRAYLLDPSHPLLHPLGLAFFRLWQTLGWTGQSLVPLQVLNALAGAVCAGLVADIVRRLSGLARLALVTGLGFAVSGGLWMLSVEAEFVSVPLAAALLILWTLFVVTPEQAGSAKYVILLALVTAVAFWSYASGALLYFVVLTGVLMDQRLPRSVRRRQALIYSGALLFVFIPATTLFLSQWSRGDWARVPAYFLGRGGYSSFALRDLPHSVYAFLRSLALYPHLSLVGTTRQFLVQASPAGRGLFVAYYALALLVVCTPLALTVRHRQSLLAAYRRPMAVLAVWSAGFAVFAFFWVPGDVSFWLPLLAAWWLLLALAISAVTSDATRTAKTGRWLTGLTVAVIALAIANATFEVLPRRDLATNLPYQVAMDVAAQTGDDVIFLTRGDDISGLYLAYFAGRQVFYATPETLVSLHSMLPPSAENAAPRVVTLDVDSNRSDWWQALLATSPWQAVEPHSQLRAGMLIELAPR